jgi:hypothetical protein
LKEKVAFPVRNRDYGCRGSALMTRDTRLLHKLALTSPTSSGRSVGVVRSRIHATEFVFVFVFFRHMGARGSVVVEALCYNPEGRGFETR